MKEILIPIFLGCLSFYWIFRGKESRVLSIIVFLLAFFGKPLHNIFIKTGLQLDMSGIVIIFVWIAYKLKYLNTQTLRPNWKELSSKIVYIYFFLISGTILGLLYLKDANESLPDFYSYPVSPMQQLLSNILNIVVVIMFLKILVNFKDDAFIKYKMARALSYTIYLHVLSQFLKYFGVSGYLANLFFTQGSFNTQEVRNIGMYSGFGMGVYIVLLISFSIMYFKENKLFSVTTIFATIIFSFFSASRQNLVFGSVFILVFLFVTVFKRKFSLQSGLLILIVILFVGLLFSDISKDFILFRRFDATQGYWEKSEYLEMTGRNVIGITYVLNEIKDYPITGKGLLDLYTTKYSVTNIAGHVVWLNIFKKFGILGVISLFLLLINPIKKLFMISTASTNKKVVIESGVYLALSIIVFLQQFLDNFFWYSNTMLLYAFIFFLIKSFINNIFKYENG